MKFYLFHPLVCTTEIQTTFSFAPDKRPENIPDPDEVISGQQRLHIDTEDAQKQREILMTQTSSSVGGGFSIVRTLKASGAPPEASRGRSEDHFQFIAADADRSIGSSEGKLSD